jgi:hypothetical protein
MHNLSSNSTIQHIGQNLTAGTDGAFVQPAVSVDMSGFDSCMFIAIVTGVATAQFAIRVKAASTTGGHSAVGSTTGVVAAIPATLVDNTTLVFRVDVTKPRDGQRWLRAEYQRTVANSQVVIIAVPYNAKTQAAVQNASVAASVAVAGVAGAA